MTDVRATAAGEPAPTFSVVVATYDRGAHIRPTLHSVLEQTFRDFELIVVGDGCNDDTMDVVRAVGSAQISTYELPANSGSQSAPNNLGVARSRGRYIAYLGHDDIWHPDHLANIADTFARGAAPDVVASGCVYHGPQKSGITFVTGLLDGEHPPSAHFLPPSALAHRRDLLDRIGLWRDPHCLSAPADSDIMLRAERGGARFASTGKVTVHKFAAGHRYLSYLRPASTEQELMLSGVRRFGPPSAWDFLVEAARRQGRYMTMKHFDYEALGKGHIYRQNRSNKGLRRPPLRELAGKVVLEQTEEARGLDWHELEDAFRWSGPSPRPHVLIPFKGDCTVYAALDVREGTPDEILDAISVECEGQSMPHVVTRSAPHIRRIELAFPLNPDDYTVLCISTPRMFRPSDRTAGGDTRLLGIALGDIEIDVTSPGSS
jgi:glycosyltransferase involved in cell wall biosynthesis